MTGLKLIGVYIGFVLAFQLVAYGVGRVTEAWWPTASLPAFLTLFFLAFWAGWKLAVRVA